MLRSREPADGGAVPAAQREVRPGSGLRRASKRVLLRAYAVGSPQAGPLLTGFSAPAAPQPPLTTRGWF